MSAHVLILDTNFMPLQIVSWQRVIGDVMLGKQEVIHYSADKTIQGVHQSYPMPSVVRVLRKFKRSKIQIKFSRINIYTRDGFVCQYCAKRFHSEDLTFDHVLPRSRGGKTSWENIVAACSECNDAKADRTPEEAGMKLLRKPAKPTYLPVVTVARSRSPMPPEWSAYWSGPLDP